MTFRTALRRTVAVAVVLLVAAGAFAAGFVVANARRGDAPPYRLAAAGLDGGLSCDRLRQWYVDHALDRVTAWGWQSAIRAVPLSGVGTGVDAAGAAPSAPNASLETRTGSSTGTNVQEAGVDEPDVVKVSGDLLVRISEGSLKTDDVGGDEPRRLGVVPLDRIGNPQLLLSGDRAVVVGSELEDPAAGAPLVPPPPRTWVRTYDLGDPRNPTLVDSRLYGGSLVTARQVGSVVRLVLDAGLPSLDFTRPSSSVSEKQSLEHNRQVVRDSTVTDWLPNVITEGPDGSAPLVDCADVAVPETFNGLGTLAVVGFDPASPDAVDPTAVATSSETAYLSPTHLYVATSPWASAWRGFGPPVMPPVMPTEAREPTRIYGFDLSGTSARYVGMGSVDGTVAGSWSMDEHGGALRVAVAARCGTSVVVLRPGAGRLLDVGRVDGLGPDQELKSVRWFDDLAVLVTFRQTDPFYVVDVSEPTDPRVLGVLHLPGWSSYLHPVGPHLLLGLGQSAPRGMTVEPLPSLPTLPTMPPVTIPPKPAPEGPSDGTGEATASPVPVEPPHGTPVVVPEQHAKATLFDISDLAHPRGLDTVTYPMGSVAMAGIEPHQVTWLPDQGVLLTVVTTSDEWVRASVSVLTIRDGDLSNRMVPVPATSDVNDVRTVPLTDGRVVLVAGDSVDFLTV